MAPFWHFFMDEKPKNKLVQQEEEILAFWQKEGIFEKSLEKNNGGKEFVFYEGPPTANAKPGIHHLEARAFKDAIPRYKTMRGYRVPRKGGWDTHGLPVELQVEKELGLKSKKEIEKYGIAEFNEHCRVSVWKHVNEWTDFTNRIGYWVDLKNPYITYQPQYIESLWNIVKHVHGKGLLYKDYKVVPWCPRCGTALSSHELAQGYEDVKDLSVYVKFKVVGKDNTYLLAWTTTPWTLPGNVALAVGAKIEYTEVELEETKERLILATKRLSVLKDKKYKVFKVFASGEDLVGGQYEPIYPFMKTNGTACKVYAADFVTTADGTGIVHIAPMYGQDDFELGTKVGLPKQHLVKDDGTFKEETGFLAGKFVKDPETDVAIIKDLAGRGLLFDKEKYQHSYPFCWRCHTPLIYFARDSWYIKMSALKDKLVAENQTINWEPSYIKDGRFGEWLREIKDWAISRERYWGTPLPVWKCGKCHREKVAGSVADIEGKSDGAHFYLVRHAEAKNNVERVLNSDRSQAYSLTEQGIEQAKATGEVLARQHIDVIFSSPFQRTRETAGIIAERLGIPQEKIVFDERLREMGVGELEGMPSAELSNLFINRSEDFYQNARGIEGRLQIKARVASFLQEVDAAYAGKNVLIVSHDGPLWMMTSAAEGFDVSQSLAVRPKGKLFMQNSAIKELKWRRIPRNRNFELDLHRPYIDAVKLVCDHCGGEMERVKEVMDVWFDSGAMPFAEEHYPFENRERIDSSFFHKAQGYPADFISEAIDQTRGWFYTLHAVGILMGKGKAYKNVICLGHILDAQGKKMSKSLGNTVDPWLAIEKYGADPLRFWMYSVNQPGEAKNFDERTVDEVVKKVFNLAANVLSFYLLYAPEDKKTASIPSPVDVLDRWILARLSELTLEVTKRLDAFQLLEPTRAIREFIEDLSQWYLRRSRERIKGDDEKDKAAALATLREILIGLSKLMAPFTPFFAEYLYKNAGGARESVHLEDWPEAKRVDQSVIADMKVVRDIVSRALETRAKTKINVRQPLAKLTIKTKVSAPELILDEVNVKEIVVDAKLATDVELDTAITPALKREGDLREAIRTIQELRKQKGLKPGQSAILSTSSSVAATGLLQEFESEIKKSASLSKINHGVLSSGDFELK